MAGGASATEIDDAMVRYRGRIVISSLSQGQLEMRTRQTAAGPAQYPYALTGAFARVFTITDIRGIKRAVRCFYNIPKPEYQKRYSTIANFFRQHVPTITADFQFHEQGIRVKVKPPELTMPLIEMEWVEGDTLLAYVDLLANQRNVPALRQLATRWVGLIQQMRKVGMAHGDLSGTNVMVRRKDAALVLIDYDGVFLPPFAGQTTDQAGNPPYQHPDLQNRPYDEKMDNFSALLIYVALYALSERPSLWRDPYCVHDAAGILQSEELLFRVDDLRNPGRSRLFAEFASISDASFQRALTSLRDACLGRVDAVPDFLKIVDPEGDQKEAFAQLETALRAKDDRATVKAADNPALKNYPPSQHPQIVAEIQQTRQRVQQADELVRLLSVGDEQSALQVWLKNGFNYTSLAREFAPQMPMVQQRVEKLNSLKSAISSKDDRAILDAWDAILFKNYKPAQPYAAVVENARKCLALTQPLQDALKLGDDLAVERHWPALQNYGPVQSLRPQVQAALDRVHQKRKAVFDSIATAISRDDDSAILAAANSDLIDAEVLTNVLRTRIGIARTRIKQEEQIKQLLTSENDEATLKCWESNEFSKTHIAQALAPRVEVVRKRLRLLQKLTEALAATGNPEQDRMIMNAWNETLFQYYRKANVHRKAYEAAKTRLIRLDALDVALKQNDDMAALRVWDTLKTYGPALSYGSLVAQIKQRVEQRRQKAINVLEQAIRLGDDRAILDRWHDPLLSGLTSINIYESRVRQAQDRVSTIEKIEQSINDVAQEEHVLNLWNEQGLVNSPLAKHLRVRIEHIKRRRYLLDMLKHATKTSNDSLLLTLWDDNLLLDYEPARQYLPSIKQVQQRLRTVEALRAALGRGNDHLVMILWDKLKVSDLPEAVTYDKDVRAAKLRWLASHVPTNLQGSIEKGTMALTWDWPEGLPSMGVKITVTLATGAKPHLSSALPLRTVSHTQYLRQGNYTSLVGQAKEISVSVFPLVSHGKQWLLDKGVPAVHVRLKPRCIVSYKLVREDNDKVYLQISAHEASMLPTLLIVASSNQVPRNAATGTTIGTVGAGHGVAAIEGIYHIPVSLKGWKSPAFLALFPANHADSDWLTLLPENGVPIQFA